jgi:hypothetical protein
VRFFEKYPVLGIFSCLKFSFLSNQLTTNYCFFRFQPMTAAFRGFLLVLILFVSLSGYTQTETKVYVTKTGAKYHKSSCRYAQTGWASSLSDAKDRGLTACLVCKPGGGDASTSGSASSTGANALKASPTETSNPPASTASSQCRATTKAGSRCSRKAASGSSYCWQHSG